jgi:predicted N-acetyltransferase YhbS
MQMHIIDEAAIDAVLDAAIRHGLCEAFPQDAAVFTQTRAWHGSAPAFTAVISEGERVVAHVGIVERLVMVGEERVRVAGIQNVFVLPGQRGQGLSDRLMQAAMDEARQREYDAGLLFCVPALEALYVRMGWKAIAPPSVTRVDETGQEVPLPGKNIAMFYPLRYVEFPAGPIHLGGNDW